MLLERVHDLIIPIKVNTFGLSWIEDTNCSAVFLWKLFLAQFIGQSTNDCFWSDTIAPKAAE